MRFFVTLLVVIAYLPIAKYDSAMSDSVPDHMAIRQGKVLLWLPSGSEFLYDIPDVKSVGPLVSTKSPKMGYGSNEWGEDSLNDAQVARVDADVNVPQEDVVVLRNKRNVVPRPGVHLLQELQRAANLATELVKVRLEPTMVIGVDVFEPSPVGIGTDSIKKNLSGLLSS